MHDRPGANAFAHLPDVALVRDALQRRADALEQFIERMQCVGRFLAVRNAQLGQPLDRDELRDVAQDAITVVWRKLEAFSGDASLETWVFRICVNELMNTV